MPITGCRDKKTRQFMAGERVKEFEAFAEGANKAITKLQATVILADLWNPPSNRFEALHGDREGEYSIRFNRKNRVCFKWNRHASVPDDTDDLQAPGDAYDVIIEIDYH